jgi:cytochrome c556
MKTRVGMMALLSAVLLLVIGAQGADYAKVQKERSDLMKANSKDNKALGNAVKEGNMADVEKYARELAAQFASIANPCLFPKGSGEGTRAKPEVWTNWSDFEEKASTARKLALAVAANAKAGKTGETESLAGSLAKQACTNCHKTFRGPKPKK